MEHGYSVIKVEKKHRRGEADTGEDERYWGETKEQELPRLNLTDGQTNLGRSFLGQSSWYKPDHA